MNKLNHIAFIMDGNGRWGKKKGKNRNFGHLKGVEVVKKIVKASIKLKIPVLSFYVFSSENWKRPKKEINFLFKLINIYFLKEIDSLIKQNIKINILGDLKPLPLNVKKILNRVTKLTKNNNTIKVNLALNYGARDEIIMAFKKIKKNLSKKQFEKNLFTKNMPNPDILIRTGGHKRLSNFLLWQLAYTELFFLEKLWPDFKVNDLKKIIKKYKTIKRNFGTI